MSPYKDKAKRKRYQAKWVKKKRKEIKAKLFEMYGDKCAICGYSDKGALSLDHINNDGASERKRLKSSTMVYTHAILKYNPQKYQILCHNCNILKHKESVKRKAKQNGRKTN